MITKLQITGKLHYHRKCDFQLSKRKLGYRTLLPLTAPITHDNIIAVDRLTLIYCSYGNRAPVSEEIFKKINAIN